jgi:hypothetical protein
MALDQRCLALSVANPVAHLLSPMMRVGGWVTQVGQGFDEDTFITKNIALASINL